MRTGTIHEEKPKRLWKTNLHKKYIAYVSVLPLFKILTER